MTNFHPHTIDELRNELDGWRERLDNAEVDLRFREGQAAKAREVAEAARQRVGDYERLLAVVEGTSDTTPAVDEIDEPLAMDAEEYHASIWTDAIATASTAQLEGVACINCARVFGGEPNHPVAAGPRGALYAHTNPEDCKLPKDGAR